jgi:excisionase family DNA binding protein
MTDLRLLDAAGLAELLDIPKTWLLAEARAERIPHVRLGRYVRFDPQEVEAWLKARRRGPAARKAAA